MAKPTPYTDQRKNMTLAAIWFLIPMVGLGIGAPFLHQTMAIETQDTTMPFFFLGTAVVFMVLGALIGVKPLLASLTSHNDFKSEDVKGKIYLTGILFLIPALAGALAWILVGAWWVYAIGIAGLAAIVFFVMIPNINKLYDFLELQLQRKEDGGTVAVAKKTTYDL